MSFRDVVAKQRQFFSTHVTLDAEFRRTQLQKLAHAMHTREAAILDALREDLAKPEMESVLSETGGVQEEIKIALKNLDSWMHPERVSTPLIAQPGKSFIHPEPKGVVLVMSPWNYPISLALNPVVGAPCAASYHLREDPLATRSSKRLMS